MRGNITAIKGNSSKKPSDLHYKSYKHLTVHLCHVFFLFSAFIYMPNQFQFEKGFIKNFHSVIVYI